MPKDISDMSSNKPPAPGVGSDAHSNASLSTGPTDETQKSDSQGSRLSTRVASSARRVGSSIMHTRPKMSAGRHREQSVYRLEHAHDRSADQAARRVETVVLGTGPQGVPLVYDSVTYGFSLGRKDVALVEVRKLDDCGLIQWRFMEQRDWMRRLDVETVEKLHTAMLSIRLEDAHTKEEIDAYIADHVRKDNSYIHGHIVETERETTPQGSVVPVGSVGGAVAGNGVVSTDAISGNGVVNTDAVANGSAMGGNAVAGGGVVNSTSAAT